MRLESLGRSYEKICLIKDATRKWRIRLKSHKELQRNTAIGLTLLYQNRTSKIFEVWREWTKYKKSKRLKAEEAFEIHKNLVLHEWTRRLDQKFSQISKSENEELSGRSLELARKFICKVILGIKPGCFFWKLEKSETTRDAGVFTGVGLWAEQKTWVPIRPDSYNL